MKKLYIALVGLLVACSAPDRTPNYKIEDIKFREIDVRKETTRYPEMMMDFYETWYIYDIKLSAHNKAYKAQITSRNRLNYQVGDSICTDHIKIYQNGN